MTHKRYRVYAMRTARFYIDVEAETEEEAYDKADETDFDKFEPVEEFTEEVERNYYDCEQID